MGFSWQKARQVHLNADSKTQTAWEKEAAEHVEGGSRGTSGTSGSRSTFTMKLGSVRKAACVTTGGYVVSARPDAPADGLQVPDNVTLVKLPPYASELTRSSASDFTWASGFCRTPCMPIRIPSSTLPVRLGTG